MPHATSLCRRWVIALVTILGTFISAQGVAAAPVPIKVVVVSMFETGKPTGDEPGEFQFWIERQKLDQVLPFPLGEYDLYYYPISPR